MIQITDGPSGPVRFLENFGCLANGKPFINCGNRQLVIAGEQAGFSLEQMIELLNQGLSVETLLALISARLEALRKPTVSSSGWIV